MKLPRICNYKLLRTNLQNHRSHSVSICGAAIPPSHSVSYPEAAQVKRSQLMLSRSNNRDLSEKQTVALIHNRRRRPYSICAVRVIVHIVFSSLVHIVQFHSITFTSRARARVPIVTQAGHGRAHVISVCLPPARASAGLPSICCFSRTRKLPPPVPSQASASLSSQIASKMRASHFSRARADRTTERV